MPIENIYQTNIEFLSKMFPDIQNFVVNYYSGIEDDDEPEYNQDMFFKCLGVLVTKLSEVGIVFNDSSEVISSGGMRDLIPLFAVTFNDNIGVNILQHSPDEFVEELSNIVHSDDLEDSEVIHNVIGIFKEFFTLTNKWELAVHYQDIYYSTHDFVLWFRKVFDDMKKLPAKDNSGSEENTASVSIRNFFRLVTEHLFDVYNLISAINSKLDLLLDVSEIENMIKTHDRDLLSSSNLGDLAFDKSLSDNLGYHDYILDTSKTLLDTHKHNNPHHIEYFIEKSIQPSKLQLVFIVADLYYKGMAMEEFESKCEILINKNYLLEESITLVKNIMSVLKNIDLSNPMA